jgi:rubrerythrin
MDPQLQQQKDNVDTLKAAMAKYQSKLYTAKAAYDKALRTLQKQCPHTEYEAESDSDYHRPGYIYTCKLCGYITKMKPIVPDNNKKARLV